MVPHLIICGDGCELGATHLIICGRDNCSIRYRFIVVKCGHLINTTLHLFPPSFLSVSQFVDCINN